MLDLVFLDGVGPVPPIREHADLYLAHDLLTRLVDNTLPAQVVGMGLNLNTAIARAEVLCWALHHDTRNDFDIQIKMLANAFKTANGGVGPAFIDTRQYKQGGQR